MKQNVIKAVLFIIFKGLMVLSFSNKLKRNELFIAVKKTNKMCNIHEIHNNKSI